MSYIAKKGKAAAQSATQEKPDFSKALVPFKSGSNYKVRLVSDEDFVEYYAASVFKVFHTTPVQPGNLYQKAADILFADAKEAAEAGNETEAEELRAKARQLKPKPRYLFGFINLDDGQPIIVDTSKAQAQVLIKAIDKYAKKLDKVAFELSKEGNGRDTIVSLTPILDMDDLTEKQRANFEKAAEATIPDDLYENVLKVKSEAEQIEDLKAFGFDVSRLGIEETEDPTVEF